MDPVSSTDDWGLLADAVGYVFPVAFSGLFIALTVCVFILIRKLRQKNSVLSADDVIENFFRKEINTVAVIMCVFSISYFLRVLFDALVGFQ